jgi:hypothetical protein
MFRIITDKSKSSKDDISICKNCEYRDKWGQFEKTNRSNLRDEKIDQILYGI